MSASPQSAAQSFENHARFVPGYHVWTTALLFFPTLWFGYRAVAAFSVDALALFLFAVGALLAGYWLRAFPLGVQDRLIRLEERMRLERILPADLRPRVPELSTKQLVALRFASDDEVSDLVRRTLAHEFAKPRDIKRAVGSWRADHQRI
jgi:Family of unknown function (DUF6526)